MIGSSLSRQFGRVLKHTSFYAECEEGGKPDLIQQADASLVKEKPRISTPDSYENVKNSFNQTAVGSYDGLRLIVQKQVNLNTVVNHFYWVGSAAMEKPLYQYRIILPFDESGGMVNVASDASLNVEGEVRYSVAPNVSSKVNFVVGEQQNVLTGDLEITDEHSNTLLQFAKGPESSASLSYMQALTPALTLGGTGAYSFKSASLSTGLAGVLTHGEHSFTAQWDRKLRVMYVRKVNPNRVLLSTDLSVDETGNSQMTLSAEYILKQSKLQMSVDSNLQIKSLVDTNIGPGMQLQFAAEVNQPANSYRFGYGLILA